MVLFLYNNLLITPEYEVPLLGCFKKLEAKLESSFDLSVSYYSLNIADKNVVEMDVLNNISNINGTINDKIREFL
ncbi:phage major tail tube protein [Pseudostreptobacillus hongkongensis]|uniref:phage major tail tube protein n=1 Tax=Pseudostreptobacillus hongkongensis TaxID=1162717 RepID=UPI0028D5B782|nr:phage major tail tube protein [Pseudostreptobacillus hongkongensis]